jgi:hypothetical protein
VWANWLPSVEATPAVHRLHGLPQLLLHGMQFLEHNPELLHLLAQLC